MFIKVLDFSKFSVQDSETITRLCEDSRLIPTQYKEWLRKPESVHIQCSEMKVWNGIEFYFCSNHLDIKIKPHYLFNDGKHNANDFSIADCIQTLWSLVNEFNLSPTDLKVMQIEYGFNFISPIPVQDLIASLEYHERNRFDSSNDGLKFSKVSGKASPRGTLSRYKRIKLYAKGIQQPLYADENSIRFEIHSDRTNFIESLGIYTLKDLLEYHSYEILADSLKEEFQKILFLDYDNSCNNLTQSEKKKVQEFNNPRHWYVAIQAHRNTFNNNKKSYLNLLDKTGENIHRKLNILVNEKIEKLLKPCAILTPSENTNLVQF